jgi:hypothetical protein
MPSYSYTNLKDQIIDTQLYQNTTTSTAIRNSINRAARIVNSEIDLRSAKRVYSTVQKIFDNIYDYVAPTDLKGMKVIDIYPQANRSSDTRRFLTTPAYFDRKKDVYGNMVAVLDNSFTRTLRACFDVIDTKLTVSSFNSLTDDGSWVLFGDGENVAINTDNFITGSGAVSYDISAAGGTTAGIQNSTIEQIDISDFVTNGSAFVWAYIVDTTNITNFKIRLGNSSTVYYEMTATTKADGTAFSVGWNLLKFNFAGKSETGSVTDTTIDYLALYMTKDGAKVSETGYLFDDLQLHTGEYHNILYYSKYPWQTSTGVYIENSTADTDKINADTDEMELFVFKGKEEVFRDLRDYDQMKLAQSDYEKLKLQYKLANPSEALQEKLYYY